MHSLVTGGAGFIGSHVVDHLIQSGQQVTVADDLSGGYRGNVNSAASFVRADMSQIDAVDALFRANHFDRVYHLAAYAAEGLSHFIKRFNYTNNLISSVNLINASVRSSSVKCFVFTSSIAVYGEQQSPISEETTPLPEDPYGIAKYAVELDLAEASAMFGLRYVVFRPHNVYGERQNLADPFRNVVGIFIRQALCDQPFTIFGDGTQTRGFSHISDVAPIIAAAPDNPLAINQVVNVGADAPLTVNHIAQLVAKHMGVPYRAKYLPARREARHAFCSHEKAGRVFGRTAAVAAEDGIARMCAWARETGIPALPALIPLEVEQGLPAAWAQRYSVTV